MSDKKTPLDTALEAMESLQNTIAFDVADWAADKRMAWIGQVYGPWLCMAYTRRWWQCFSGFGY
jgi:hypothetical protein